MQTIFKKVLHIWFYASGIRSAADAENCFKIRAIILKYSVICCINQDSSSVVTFKDLVMSLKWNQTFCIFVWYNAIPLIPWITLSFN